VNDASAPPGPPDPLVAETRAFWREIGKAMVRESLGTLDEMAKQLIGVAGIPEGLYFHAIAFGDLRGQVKGLLGLLYVAPVLLPTGQPGGGTAGLLPRALSDQLQLVRRKQAGLRAGSRQQAVGAAAGVAFPGPGRGRHPGRRDGLLGGINSDDFSHSTD
jgi:hypothetical protein